MKKLFTCKKGIAAIGSILVLLISLPFAASVYMWQTTDDLIYSDIESIPQKETALVLGAAVYPARLSDILQDRVDTAIDLYNNKKVSKIIMSGASNESVAMAKYAAEKGVPTEFIQEDPNGLDTMSSVKNAKNSDSLIIVSQSYHLPRAVFIARHYGMDAVGFSSDRRKYIKIVDFKKREVLASTAAMLKLMFSR